MKTPFLAKSRMVDLVKRIQETDQLPNILDIQCDHYSNETIIYHAKWELNGKVEWSIVKGGGTVQECFEAIQDRCILDAIGKRDVLTEYEYASNAYRVPFGRYKGIILDDVPEAFLSHWAKKNPDNAEGVVRELILKCQDKMVS